MSRKIDGDLSFEYWAQSRGDEVPDAVTFYQYSITESESEDERLPP